jgi:hypothetical protein
VCLILVRGAGSGQVASQRGSEIWRDREMKKDEGKTELKMKDAER